MSGELQTIPARHGVATFVPRGRTIKIVNTYGKQVISTWAFALGAPPDDGEEESGEGLDMSQKEIEEKADELAKEIAGGKDVRKAEEEEGKTKELDEKDEMKAETKSVKDKGKEDKNVESKQSSATPEKDEGNKSTDEQILPENIELPEDPPEMAPEDLVEPKEQTETKKQAEKRTWSSYLPSIPYRSKGSAGKTGAPPETQTPEPSDPEAEKAKNEATSKKWSSYLPTGKSFSSYVPNVQIPEKFPDRQEVVSAFKASHHRDPDKSYAQQLYDFSRTPVGAASLAAATGSGTASSLYAAYTAFTKMNPSSTDQPPMEYLSLPHTRAALKRLVPKVDDTLLTNLRNPIMTLIEDTTPGAHDTLMAACDAAQYAALSVDKPEEHGSCAENLVLALKEVNEKAGLKGAKAVGADITVYVAPTPLHLFMNAPIEMGTSAKEEGAGARGATVKVEAPKGKKRSFVRFRAERDIVVVMSACPMDMGPQNGERPMAANFMVEEVTEEEMAASISSLKSGVPKKEKTKVSPSPGKASPSPGKKSPTPAKASPSPKEKTEEEGDAQPKKAQAQAKGGADKPDDSKKAAETARRDSGVEEKKKDKVKSELNKPDSGTSKEVAKPRKKPKKLERRSERTATPSSEGPRERNSVTWANV